MLHSLTGGRCTLCCFIKLKRKHFSVLHSLGGRILQVRFREHIHINYSNCVLGALIPWKELPLLLQFPNKGRFRPIPLEKLDTVCLQTMYAIATTTVSLSVAGISTGPCIKQWASEFARDSSYNLKTNSCSGKLLVRGLRSLIMLRLQMLSDLRKKPSSTVLNSITCCACPDKL